MIIIIIIILLGLIVYKLYTLDCKYENMTQLEHMQSTTNPESVCNIASVYNNEMLSVSNATITKELKADSVTVNSLNILPKGLIIAWYPNPLPIDATKLIPPVGWLICDGTNGTPDLRGRFIRMYSDTLQANGMDLGNSLKSSLVNISDTIKFNTLVGNSITEKKSTILPFKIGEFAGTDNMKLDVTEMPPHSHSYYDPLNGSGRYEGKDNTRDVWEATKAPKLSQTSITGGYNSSRIANGHNNIPPFFTLVYLIKT